MQQRYNVLALAVCLLLSLRFTVWAASISDTTPANNAINVDLDTALTITFDSAVTIGSGSIVISLTSTNAVAETINVNANDNVSLSPSGKVVTITPSLLADTTSYYIQIGGSAFVGFAGILSTTSWRFTTIDETAPTLSSFSPTGTGLSTSLTLMLNFDENVFASVGNIEVKRASDDSGIVSIGQDDPSIQDLGSSTISVSVSGLSESVMYYVLIDAGMLQDAAGNSYQGIADISKWTFSTGDFTPPQYASLTPENNQVNMDLLSTNLLIAFTEDISIIAGGSVSIYTSTGTLSETIGIDSAQVNGDGSDQIIINPSINFVSDTTYYIRIAADTFQDAAGNKFAAISDSTSWSFSTTDSIDPVVMTLNPLNGTTNVDPASIIYIQFSEPVDITSNLGMGIYQMDDTQVASFSSSSAALSGSGTATISIDLSKLASEVPQETELWVYINVKSFEDVGGNRFAGYLSKSDWTFKTGDTIAPVIDNLSPPLGSTNIDPATSIIISFSEDVVLNLGNVVIYIREDDLTQTTIAIDDSSQVTVSSAAITITPTGPLPDATTLYVKISSSAITDSSGNAFAGIDDTTTWLFTTRDETAPIIVSTNPTNGATGIHPSSDFTITFDEVVTTYPGTITLYDADDDDVVHASFTTSAIDSPQITGTNTKEIQIRPTKDLEDTRTYYIQITSTVINDLSGNDFPGILDKVTWSFTTGDINPPSIEALSPAVGELRAAVESDLSLTFNEPIQPGSGNIQIFRTSDDTLLGSTLAVGSSLVSFADNKLVINPSANMDEKTGYHVIIPAGAIMDLSGNSFPGMLSSSEWYFTSGDFSPPTLESSSPADDETKVPVDTTLVMIFSEPVTYRTGFLTLKRSTDDFVYTSVDVSGTFPSNGTISGNSTTTITVTLAANLPQTTELYVDIDSGIFRDLYYNKYAGTVEKTTWSFTTVDTTKPSIVSLSPTLDSTDVSTSTTLEVSFDEIVYPKSGGSVNIFVSGPSPVFHETVNTDDPSIITGDGTTDVKIVISKSLSELTQYFIEISSDAFADASGNYFNGISGSDAWKWTTGDFTDPVLLAQSPIHEATSVGLSEVLVLSFSEPVNTQTGIIQVHKKTDDSVHASINVDGSAGGTLSGGGTNSIVLDLDTDLEQVTEYYVTIPGTAFVDNSNNFFTGIPSKTGWVFISEDVKAPSYIATVPIADSTTQSPTADLVITFDEDMQIGSGSVEIRRFDNDVIISTVDVAGGGGGTVSVSGTVVTINPSANLIDVTKYYVIISPSSFLDSSANANAFAGITSKNEWVFTTADTTGPAVELLSPFNGETDLTKEGNLKIIFNEIVAVGSGNIHLYRSDDVLIESIVATSAEITGFSTKVIDISLGAALVDLTSYYIIIPPKCIEDVNGNAFGGLTRKTDWRFSIGDFTSPTIVAVNPTDGSTLVPTEKDLEINFDETVFSEAGGTITIHLGSDDSVVETVNVDATDASINGFGSKTLKVYPSITFEQMTDYYILISPNAIADATGNVFAGITSSSSWNFQTGDTIAPQITTTTPLGSAVAVAKNQNLIIHFNEVVVAQDNPGSIAILSAEDNAMYRLLSSTSSFVQGSGTTTITVIGNDFEDLTEYYVTIEDSALEDQYGNAFEGVLSSSIWSFTTGDFSAPQVTSSSPANGAMKVNTISSLTLTLNEAVSFGTGIIKVFESTGGLWGTFDISGATAASGSVSGDGTAVITIDPTDSFDSETAYYVEVPSGTFVDASGNFFAGITSDSEWAFTTEDTSPPISTTFSPNFVNEDPKADLVISFNEQVVIGTGIIRIITKESGETRTTIDVSSESGGKVGGSGSDSIILSSIDPLLEDLTEYYVTIDATCFEDLSGNNYAGITTDTEWTFITGDFTPPSIISLAPFNGETNVYTAMGLELAFDEEISIDQGIISIYQSLDNALVESVNCNEVKLDSSEMNATAVLQSDFQEATQYYVKVDPRCFVDATGNSNNFDGIVEHTQWSFITGDSPEIISSSPVNGATKVGTNSSLTLTLNEAVSFGTGLIKVFESTGGLWGTFDISGATAASGSVSGDGTAVITIDPTDSFDSETAYYVEVPSGTFVDKHKFALAGITSDSEWAFTTEDVLPPTVASLSPASAATNVAGDANIVITFNEQVVIGTGIIRIITKESGETRTTIDVSSESGGKVGGSGSDSIILSSIDPLLEDLTEYYVTIDATCFEDLSGNNYAGITTDTEWTFTTGDDTSPSIISLAPFNGENNVNVTLALRARFSEDIQINGNPGTAAIEIRELSDDTLWESFSMNGTAKVAVAGTMLTLTPDKGMRLKDLTSYYVIIPSGILSDTNGNENNFSGLTSTDSWRFTTGDRTGPVLISVSPTNGSTNVSLEANLVVEFSENVVIQTLSDPAQALIQLYSKKDDEEVIAFDTGDLAPISGNNTDKIVFTLPFPLADSTSYYVLIPSSTFRDVSEVGNFFAGIGTSTEWEFTTGDFSPPEIVNFSPVANSDDIPLTPTLIMTFSEQVYPTTGAVSVVRSRDSFTVASFDVTSSKFTGWGSITVQRIMDTGLDDDTQYHVEIDANAIIDKGSNPYAGIREGNTAEWNFTTIDNTPPTLIENTPTQPDTSVLTNLVMTFDEGIAASQLGKAVSIYRSFDDSLVESFDSSSSRVAIDVGKSIVTIDPKIDLADKTTFYVLIDSGFVVDSNNNYYAGISSSTEWTFATEDITAPSVLSLTPSNGAVGTSKSPTLIITFDEAVAVTSGSVHIHRQSDSTLIESVEVNNPTQVSVNNDELSVFVTSVLDDLTEFYILIESDSIKDKAGNSFSGISDPNTWSFTVADTTAPLILSLSPSIGQSNVDLNADLVLTFNEVVNSATTGNIIIYRSLDNYVMETIPISAAVGTGTSTLTVNPDATLTDSTDFYVLVSTQAIEDDSGNKFAGYSSSSGWSFSTLDATAPVAITFVPINQATDVSSTPILVITFSEAIDLKDGILSIYETEADTLVESVVVAGTNGAVSLSDDGFSLVVKTGVVLSDSTNHYVLLDEFSIADVSNNAFFGIASRLSWTFTTGDYTAPILQATSPVSGADGVALNPALVLTFDNVVVVASGDIIISKTSDNSVVETIDITSGQINGEFTNELTVSLLSHLVDMTNYFVTVSAGAIVDQSGNGYAGFTSSLVWSFTTGDFVRPEVVYVYPISGSSNVGISTNLTISFNEPVDAENGNVVIYRSSPLSPAILIDMSSSTAVSGSGTTSLLLSHSSTLMDLTVYHVIVPSGAIDDISGNSYLGITTPSSWTFTTGDFTRPTLVSKYPSDEDSCEAKSFALDSVLVATFDEVVYVASSSDQTISIYSADSTLFESIELTSSQITGNGTHSISITPNNLFLANTTYYILISGATFHDSSVNANFFGGIVSDIVWVFTTMTGPLGLRYTPSNITLNVDVVMSPMSPIVSTDGGKPQSFSITPLLPVGLKFDSSTGTISGIPGEFSCTVVYMVRAINSGGFATTTLQISIADGETSLYECDMGLGSASNPIKFALPNYLDDSELLLFEQYFSLVHQLTGLSVRVVSDLSSVTKLEDRVVDVVEVDSAQALIAWIRYGHVIVAAGEEDTDIAHAPTAIILKRFADNVDSFDDLKHYRSCHGGLLSTVGTFAPFLWALSHSNETTFTSSSDPLYLNNTVDMCASPLISTLREYFTGGSCAPPRETGEAGVCDLCTDSTADCSRSSTYYGEKGALRGLSEYACQVAFVRQNTWDTFCSSTDSDADTYQESWCLAKSEYHEISPSVDGFGSNFPTNSFIIRRESLSSARLEHLKNALVGMTHMPVLLSLFHQPISGITVTSLGYGTDAATEAHLGNWREDIDSVIPGMSEFIACYGTGGISFSSTKDPTQCPLRPHNTCSNFETS